LRNKKLIAAIGLLATSIVIFFAWPLSFTRVYHGIEDGSFMVIWVTDITIDDNRPLHDTVGFQFYTDSTEFESIMKILRDYSYRRTFRGLTTTRYQRHFTQLEGNSAGFWLNMRVHNADVTTNSDIHSGGTNEILIDGIIYRMRSSQNIAMMNEIRDFLTENVLPIP